MRDRLIELIKRDNCRNPFNCSSKCEYVASDDCHSERLADLILADGWIRPPCKVGQEIFFYTCVCDKAGEEKYDILEGEVISFSLQKEGLWAYCRYKLGLTYWHLVADSFGKTVFLAREEAERALRATDTNLGDKGGDTE